MSELKIDEMDLKIIRILQENAKTPAKEISLKIDSPITTIYSRIKRMEDSGIIRGYKPILNAEKLGKPTTAFVFISFIYRQPGVNETLDQKKIAEEISTFPEVQEVHIISGDWDILIKIKAEDVAAVGDFVTEKLRKYYGISKTLTCMVFQSIKESLDISI
jgi:DNA-binding Lrp family transcriptional regulator